MSCAHVQCDGVDPAEPSTLVSRLQNERRRTGGRHRRDTCPSRACATGQRVLRGGSIDVSLDANDCPSRRPTRDRDHRPWARSTVIDELDRLFDLALPCDSAVGAQCLRLDQRRVLSRAQNQERLVIHESDVVGRDGCE